MEKKKKSTCGCFSFLRRQKVKTANKDFSASLKGESVSLVQDPQFDANTGCNRSVSVHGPRFSTIVHPPVQPIFFPSVQPESTFYNTIDTALSRPNTLKNLPIVPAGCQGVQLNENSNDFDKDKGKINPYFVPSNGPSPDWLAGSSKFVSPHLGSIDLSPVKMEAGYTEECSELGYLIKNGGKVSVPDIFIRSNARPSLMPVLKPTTPCLFTKRRPFALPRQENNRVY